MWVYLIPGHLTGVTVAAGIMEDMEDTTGKSPPQSWPHGISSPRLAVLPNIFLLLKIHFYLNCFSFLFRYSLEWSFMSFSFLLMQA